MDLGVNISMMIYLDYFANMLITIDDESKKNPKRKYLNDSANYKDLGYYFPTGNCTACSSIDNVSVCYWTHNDVSEAKNINANSNVHYVLKD